MNRTIVLWSSVLLNSCASAACGADPTDGFTSLPLDTSNFQIQKPYDAPVSDRYNFVNAVHKLRVYFTDKPRLTTSNTLPHTETHIHGYEYDNPSRVWEFEGYGYIPSDTSDVSIMQMLRRSPIATTLVLRIHDGDLSYRGATWSFDREGLIGCALLRRVESRCPSRDGGFGFQSFWY